MTRLEQIAEALFGEAIQLPTEQRSAFLDRECQDAPELRRAVDSRLRQHAAGEPVSSGAAETATQTVLPDRFPGTGKQLGRYRIVEPLGSGGMGVVYRAWDERLERTVALKVLSAGVLLDEEARRQFRREALALAKLNHARIAAVYDVGEQDGIDYIVMECVDGESLSAKIRSGPLSIKQATAIALQVAEALEEAHERGVIHRDLKPANVMITPKGEAKVLDFGLAKLFAPAGSDATLSFAETRGLAGTPFYMSPEQILGKPVDQRTDLWSLGVLYFESLTGRTPFEGDSGLAVLREIADRPVPGARQFRPDLPPEAEEILSRALQKDADKRYGSASEATHDLSHLLAQLTGSFALQQKPVRPLFRAMAAAVLLVLIGVIAAGTWQYHRLKQKRWAREEAMPQIANLVDERKPLAAFLLLKQAQAYLPSDPELKEIQEAKTSVVSVTSTPSGADVAIQDYLAPGSAWYGLGKTPLEKVRIPNGYFRWKVAKQGSGELIEASSSDDRLNFSLTEAQRAPAGMVYAAGGRWMGYVAFIGWVGPYKLPPYDIDRYEVTNREYQQFVDSGGYIKSQYWPDHFRQNGHDISWAEAMAQLRDTTDRPGPSTWAGGHYPEDRADYPVSGVSWYEASAYAAYAGKSLPVLAQFFQAAEPDQGEYVVAASNIGKSALAPVGQYQGVGIYGTYDLAGNVREWIANPVENDRHLILGGSWKSPSYLYTNPEALSPFDRSDANGFRCVRNLAPIPAQAAQPIHSLARDFASYKPVSDAVFGAYRLLYDYPRSPLNAKVEGIVKETRDWREEKVSFDATYNGERMAAYLFLPKTVRPPYQTVLFFPSARVLFLPPDSSALGDLNFFDYILESGRAVMYPVYEDTYERRIKHSMPGGNQNVDLTTDWYKDAGRSLDYLATRPDIDKNDFAYLGVSMGAADGVIISTLLQDRLRTAILLDGGYFLGKARPGGDQADFAPRMKKPVLMVNGRYDFTFPVNTAQDPLFRMLGTPAVDKRHVLLETPHDVTAQRGQLVKVVLEWLDRYLGPVKI